MRRALLPQILAFALLLAGSAAAGPVPYALDQDRSVVGFGYTIAGQPARGTMPVADADVFLDLAAPANSTVSAAIDAAHADAGLFLATQAMKSTTVLDTQHHPTIRFRSTRVIPHGETAEVRGDLTIRGVTRQVTLNARVYRQPGTAAGERDRLSIHLSGDVSRAAFGAGGYPDLVSDTITLDILTRIDRVR
jgi:polyisoprenoid-binding protein YceI